MESVEAEGQSACSYPLTDKEDKKMDGMFKMYVIGKGYIHVPFPHFIPKYDGVLDKQELRFVQRGTLCGTNTMPVHFRSPVEALEAVPEIETKFTKAILSSGGGMLRVKIGKGKTEKSVRVKIPVQRVPLAGFPSYLESEEKIFEASFLAPASIIQCTEDDETGEKITWFPAWLCKKKLKERNLKPARTPEIPLAWRKEYQILLREALPPAPSPEEVAAKQAAKEEQKRHQAAEVAAAAVTAQLRAEAEKSEKERKNKKHEAHLASLPRQEHVHVTWQTWERHRGKFQKIECEADDVTVAVSGSRAYLLFPNGDEQIVSTKSLKIVENDGGS